MGKKIVLSKDIVEEIKRKFASKFNLGEEGLAYLVGKEKDGEIHITGIRIPETETNFSQDKARVKVKSGIDLSEVVGIVRSYLAPVSEDQALNKEELRKRRDHRARMVPSKADAIHARSTTRLGIIITHDPVTEEFEAWHVNGKKLDLEVRKHKKPRILEKKRHKKPRVI